MVVTCFSSYYEKFTDGKVVCVDEEIPFEIPSTWSWCRMQDVIDFINGRAYKKEELLEKGKYKVLRVGNFFTNDSWFYSNLELPDDKYCCNGDLLYAWSASFGPQIWNGDKTIFHYHIWNVKYKEEVLFRDYLYYFLLADTATIKKSTTGSTMIHVSMENMKPRFIPIPPIKEQHSIVEKIQEILPVVEQYDNAQSKLDSLNKDIKPLLRKSILQEAIQGRLVPQYPTDEPASVLLQRIKEEKQRLVKEGKLKKKDVVDSTIFRGDDNKYFEKKSKETREITDEIPFDIPNSWQWCRVKQILDIGSARRVHQKDWRSTGIPFYRAREIGKLAEYGNVNNELFIDYELYKEFSTSGVPMPGDLMVTAVGTLGKVYVVKDGDLFYYKDGSVLCINNRYNLNPLYLKYVIGSPMFINQFVGESQGTTVATLTMVRFNDYLMPIPPLREQERIVKSIAAISRAGANSKTY